MDFCSDPVAVGIDPVGLERAVKLLDADIPELHDGYQLYVSRFGVPVLDHAGGEAQPGHATTTDSLMLWFSSTKPVTAIAVGQLWERGLIDLDDKMADHIDGFAAGNKGDITIRHVLTHRGGFPFADLAQPTDSWEELRDRVVGAHAMHAAGAAAAYHATAGWIALGALVEAVDGRRIDRYVREEIFEPLGMRDSWMAFPDDRFDELSARAGHVAPKLDPSDPSYGLFNTPQFNRRPGMTVPSPGASGRGPAHDLGRFYEMILGRGAIGETRIVSAPVIEAMTAVHRIGMVDFVLAMDDTARYGGELPWCLGFVPQGLDFGEHASPRSVGHSGHSSSTGFCDPDTGLVTVVITNGLPGFERNTPRIRAVTTAVQEAAGLGGPEDPGVAMLRAATDMMRGR